jgi:hypothetical protein
LQVNVSVDQVRSISGSGDPVLDLVVLDVREEVALVPGDVLVRDLVDRLVDADLAVEAARRPVQARDVRQDRVIDLKFGGGG